MNGLGIDPRILLGDIITFIVLLVILKKYAYKPFLSVLEQRRKKIEEGVKKSEEAEKSLQKIRSLAEEVKDAGEKKAKELILAAEAKAQERAKAIAAAAEEDKKEGDRQCPGSYGKRAFAGAGTPAKRSDGPGFRGFGEVFGRKDNQRPG